MKIHLAFLLLAISGGPVLAADPLPAYWSDGKAELDGYALVQPRYGENRNGRVVLVFVTEPYSRSRHVKVDRYDPGDPDQLIVLKLNVVRAFQTGIYDYRAETSLFSDPSAGFQPLEITFSMQEWCGHVFESEIFAPGSVSIALDSYFEGESGTTSVAMPAGAVAEDALMVILRSLTSDKLAANGRAMKLLGGPTYRRLHHRKAALTDSELRVAAKPHPVTVPAGTFEVLDVSYAREDGATVTYQIETAYPHRIVAWDASDGESGRLTGSTRLAYWETHREGDEKLLDKLGLRPMAIAP
ncbi:MAG: hypothetical protein U0166_12780 [Acidobacteriota bacterium]